MPDVVIPDASCLIVLSKTGELELLKQLYPKIIISKEIANEFSQSIPKWIEVRELENTNFLELLNAILDSGEASAIALAESIPNSLLILDDLKARKYAKELKLNLTGTIGVIVKAKKSGVIRDVHPIIDKFLKTDFRISPKIINEILKH